MRLGCGTFWVKAGVTMLGRSDMSSAGKYAAMTVNERLHEAGFIYRFDAAVRAGDRSRMIETLNLVALADQAETIAYTILADPARYGYPSSSSALMRGFWKFLAVIESWIPVRRS